MSIVYGDTLLADLCTRAAPRRASRKIIDAIRCSLSVKQHKRYEHTVKHIYTSDRQYNYKNGVPLMGRFKNQTQPNVIIVIYL